MKCYRRPNEEPGLSCLSEVSGRRGQRPSRARGWLVLAGAALGLYPSCAGDPFVFAALDGQAAAGRSFVASAPLPPDSGASGAGGGGSEGPSASDAAAAFEPILHDAGDGVGPCGPLRAPTAGLHDDEACVAGATFSMGSNGPVPERFADHTPAHPVTLSRFALDRFEVTWARYARCVEAGACDALGAGDACSAANATGLEHHPVQCATYAQALAFCRWDEGRSLPTEAQWELAARGPTSQDFPWGALEYECGWAVVRSPGCDDPPGSAPVDGNPLGASSDGVQGLVGNASEWTHDWFGSYGSAARTDPTGATSGTRRVVRGSRHTSWLSQSMGYLRAAALPTDLAGFRCARTIVP